jgi:Lipopolysaccharide-assembly
MILKNNRPHSTGNGRQTTDDRHQHHFTRGLWSVVCGLLIIATCSFATCSYGFKDAAPIPVEVKTFRVNYFENKAEYKNPQLSPQVTEKLKQKIISTTRLRQTNDDDAHYDISGFISAYYTSTTGITNSNSSLNRLTATFHLVFRNTLDETKNFESDVTYSVDFDANLSLNQVEQQKGDEISKNLTDAIFNKIFSNW